MHGMENIKTEGIFVEKVIGFTTKRVHSSDIVLVLKCFDDISDSPKHIMIVIAWLTFWRRNFFFFNFSTFCI